MRPGPGQLGHYHRPHPAPARPTVLAVRGGHYGPEGTNGEIYNYRELRRELADQGESFTSDSDTEVLLRLFARHGIDCVERLRGIFAFAVWDRENRRLHLARDHLGVKPLYYAALPSGFLFASELKTLTLCRDVPRDLDPIAVADHAGFIWSAGEATMLKAVKKLRPGSTMTVDGGEIRIRRYWRAPLPEPAAARPRGSPADLARLIDRVVADQEVGGSNPLSHPIFSIT